jgi:hypothetical protein
MPQATPHEVEKRQACHLDDCPPPKFCQVKRTNDAQVTGKGTWWTSWCRAASLHTQNKGSVAFMTQGFSKTVTWSGSLDIGIPILSDILSGSIGYSVETSKSVGSGSGCVNSDGNAHSVWFQEQMGWAQMKSHITVTYSGGSDWSVSFKVTSAVDFMISLLIRSCEQPYKR